MAPTTQEEPLHALGVQRADGQRRLARSGHVDHRDRPPQRHVDVDIPQVVVPGPAHADKRGQSSRHGNITSRHTSQRSAKLQRLLSQDNRAAALFRLHGEPPIAGYGRLAPIPTSSNRDLVALISLRHAEATAARAWSTSSSLPFSPPFWCRSPPGTSIRAASLTPPTFTGSNPAAVISRSIVAAARSSVA